ncbi:50S ribosomal protein L31 [Candidatus Acidulodesulfobacterium sp. H_13]|uniref:50S ribosomal protein L31 n=1 Tax=Candidatus Acidulodesulfobacterium sp. H_13 TaxID=3395470 RepID=UPI0017E17721|nr:50S ribosomal protein L31 [bacterium]
MKEGIHPEIYQTKVKCACGEEFITGSTVKEIHADICSKCHPFYTGKQKFIDSAGRIEKFNKKYGNLNKNKK